MRFFLLMKMAQSAYALGAKEELIPDVYRTIKSLVISAQSIVLNIENMKSDKHIESFFTIMQVLDNFKMTVCGQRYLESMRRKDQKTSANLESEWDDLMEELTFIKRIVESIRVPIEEERQRQSSGGAGRAGEKVFKLFQERVPQLMDALKM